MRNRGKRGNVSRQVFYSRSNELNKTNNIVDSCFMVKKMYSDPDTGPLWPRGWLEV